MYSFGGISREEEFQKSMRKEKIITLCLLRSWLGLPFCGMGIDLDGDGDGDVDVSGNGEGSSQNIRIRNGELVVKRSQMSL